MELLSPSPWGRGKAKAALKVIPNLRSFVTRSFRRKTFQKKKQAKNPPSPLSHHRAALCQLSPEDVKML